VIFFCVNETDVAVTGFVTETDGEDETLKYFP
jgi:hypothetical protein